MHWVIVRANRKRTILNGIEKSHLFCASRLIIIHPAGKSLTQGAQHTPLIKYVALPSRMSGPNSQSCRLQAVWSRARSIPFCAAFHSLAKALCIRFLVLHLRMNHVFPGDPRDGLTHSAVRQVIQNLRTDCSVVLSRLGGEALVSFCCCLGYTELEGGI